MLRIEIFKENERAEPRTINGKDGKPPRTFVLFFAPVGSHLKSIVIKGISSWLV
ncbi:hypothetical protein VCSRO17_3110 [Vibrio cholerae]|uniref:hypothetical protein n=1 Tax=Vibrio cholerae TaxID=666 RepID=UPI00165250C0|nr:hypothetical protein [Vibrio cholerae]BCK08467.1 hypothetical protein VCSRO17_3110 [Vibrio cholerae]